MDHGRISLRSHLRLSVLVALLAGTALSGVAPAAVSAESFCGQARSIAFTLAAPVSFRDPGLHRFEWRELFLDEDGAPVEETFLNQVETVAGADPYTGSVLLRLTSVWGVASDGELVTDVQAVDRDQAMRFFASVGFFKDDPFAGQNELWVRWESASGWTDWIAVPRGPAVAFCASYRPDIFRQAYGWGN